MTDLLTVLGYAVLTALALILILWCAGAYACKRLRAANQPPRPTPRPQEPLRDLDEARELAGMLSRYLSTRPHIEKHRLVAEVAILHQQYRWWLDQEGRVQVEAREPFGVFIPARVAKVGAR